MSGKKHVFVSYSHADAETAAAIAESLARAGVDFFIDMIALRVGDSLTARLGEALDQSLGLVAVISANSISSEWVKSELSTVRDRDIRVVLFKKDDCEWTSQLRLLLGDRIYLAGDDADAAVGEIPKLFPEFLGSPSGQGEKFFSLSASRENSPCVKIYNGTLQSAIEECGFGRVAVVVPTDTNVDLGGRVTSSLLSFLGLSVYDITASKSTISSKEVSLLKITKEGFQGPSLLATTVFNSSGQPCAEDQWWSAKAILDSCETNNVTVVLVPPLGTGVFGWPVRQAIVNWFYGAIRWVRQRTLVTSKSVWPVLCVPGPGDQRICSPYFDELCGDRLISLEKRYLTFKVRWEGLESDWFPVKEDVLLGALAHCAFPNIRCTSIRHGAGLLNRRTGTIFGYNLDTPLSATIFADGDILIAE